MKICLLSYRCQKWVINTRREDLQKDKFTSEKLNQNYLLCQEHFEDSQFMNAVEKKSLIHNAVPTIFKGVPNPPKPVTLKRKIPDYHPEDATLTRPSKRQNTGEKKAACQYTYIKNLCPVQFAIIIRVLSQRFQKLFTCIYLQTAS